MTTFKLMLVILTLSLGATTTVMAQPTAATCQPGYEWNPGQAVCYSICRTGETWDNSTSSCVSVCKAGYTWVSDTQSCASKCTGGQYWNVGTSSCECTSGTIWEPEQRLCLTGSEILRARELNLAKKAAEAKIAAAKKQANAAEEKANECPEGTSRDFFTKKCVSMCKASRSSTSGAGRWNYESHQCDCPAGTNWSSMGGGECKPADTGN